MEIMIGLATLLLLGLAANFAVRLTGAIFVLTPVNVYLILYVIFHFPLLFIVEGSFVLYAAAINLGLIGFLLGARLGNRKNPTHLRQSVLSRPVLVSPDSTLWVLFIFASLVSLAFYRGLPPSFSILANALGGSNVFDSLLRMSSIRADLTKSHYFGGGYTGQGALKIINEMAWQVLVAFMYLRALTTKKWWQFGLVLMVAALVIYGAGAKGPVAYIIIGVLVARSFVVNISIKQVLKYTAILFALLLVIQSAQVTRISRDNDDGYLVNVASAISHRIVAGNGLNTYHLIDLLDSQVLQHQNGRDHFVKLMNSIPGIQFETPYAHTLFWAISEGKSSDKTTYSTYTYLGGSYLDFGLAGVFFLSLLVGAILQQAFLLMMRLRWSTFNIAFSAMLTIQLGQIVAGSLVSLPATLFAATIVFFVGTSPIMFGKKYKRRMVLASSS